MHQVRISAFQDLAAKEKSATKSAAGFRQIVRAAATDTESSVPEGNIGPRRAESENRQPATDHTEMNQLRCPVGPQRGGRPACGGKWPWQQSRGQQEYCQHAG
jgi:hypothetical protein